MTDHLKRGSDFDVPPAPRRKMSATDIVLLIGAPAIAYLGGLGAGFGNLGGVILSGFAALCMVASRSIRLSRRNEPRIPPYTGYVAIAVSVVTFLTAWNLYRFAPVPDMVAYLVPLGPVLLFGLLVALMFRSPR